MLTINDKMPSFKKLSNLSVNTTIENAFPTVTYENKDGYESKLTINDNEKVLTKAEGKWLVICLP